MYLSPPNLEEYGIRVPEGSRPEASVEEALRVLMSHHSVIDNAKVCVHVCVCGGGGGGGCVCVWGVTVCLCVCLVTEWYSL